MMRISAFLFLGLFNGSEAFQPMRFATTRSVASVAMRSSRPDLHEFDFILGENSQASDASQQQTIVRSRRKVQLPGDGTPTERVTVLASSTFAGSGMEDELSGEAEEADPYADILEESSPLARYEQSELSFVERNQARLNEMDMQDIISTLIVPSIFAFAGLRWGTMKVIAKVQGKAESDLEDFAKEMLYFDGDFEEMKLCVNSYNKSLMWLGPNKPQLMLKRYLQLYSKNQIISPKAISSLSYVFSLFKLSEEKAAQILVELCTKWGNEGMAPTGRLYFMATKILKSAEGKAALTPIRDLIKYFYREVECDVEEFVERSQLAMGEFAYKTATQEGGKDQQSLTVGWKVLGLDKDTATRIWEEEEKTDFITDREKMFAGQGRKYDAKGNILDKKGEIADPENAIVDEPKPTSNVMACSDCGFTLFIAKGREEKFFGEGFVCPECGAKKDRFEPKDIDEE